MKRMTKGLAASLLLAVPLAACGDSSTDQAETSRWDEIKEDGTLTVGTAGTLYPASFREEDSDTLTGFDVELMKEVGKRLDLEVQFKEMAFDNMLTSVQNGQVDVAANDISVTDDRKEKFAFSTPYKYTYGTAIVRKSDLSGIESLEDLKGKKAAGEATTVFMDVARQYGAEEVIYDNATNDQYLRDVSTGRTDVILNDYYLQTLALAFFPEFDITIHPDIAYNPQEVAFLMDKENAELQENIDRVLTEMLEDGTVKELSETFYNGADVSVEPDVDATIVELD
ncbi:MULTISPECIES: transporter substrate-binding domain-containing protein [Exiguobacterium]|uniref:Transporter substrate-binding domain-containing protein n=1 Tax=Exiguobacterium mexicanum TaxID=340146 RepID=A0ABT7MLW2_9BACL|nr:MULTISPECIES: transporter substrate-binding domain-containing protein [Exiguobacterium]MDL5376186.1 transporter substrate-binding domain-containing protein [Exiguobacterium mexicanum]TCI67702.1 transporter substrate-binding domain-containing protein [Exiguobacterium sp. IPCI3]TCI77209.1 transporter substrate-binding domain-containing protein [Exiguobacterium sp. IPCH1]TCI78768.1 transporter substrate-binding domain-containing protein [Exiguobacterium sp. IPBC4]